MACVRNGITLKNIEGHWLSVGYFFLQHHLKDVLTAVVTRRKAYRLRDGHFPYAFGTEVTPRPYLQNSLAAYQSVSDW